MAATILIVDDEPDIRELIGEILADEDYVPVLASCAAEAREGILSEELFEKVLRVHWALPLLRWKMGSPCSNPPIWLAWGAWPTGIVGDGTATGPSSSRISTCDFL